MAHVSPAAILFSPTVARQQLAAAKDWNYVDNWLTSKFRFHDKPVPPFERNIDTLKTLLSLAALNETADEDRDLLYQIEVKALTEIQAHEAADPHAGIIEDLETHLTHEGLTALDALADASVVLGQPYNEAESLAHSLLDLRIATLDTEQAKERVTIVHKHLKMELQKSKTLVEELQTDAYQPPPDLAKQNLDYQRRMKLLTNNLPGIRDRAGLLSAGYLTPKPLVQDIMNEEERYRKLMATIKDLESNVRSYRGLPHDVDLARLELETLRMQLKDLSWERDSMFESLVERESPIKRR